MSLLLEALKKAELAKQAAKEQPPASDKPPFTRDKLPDISQPMEIRSEDLGLVQTEPTPKRVDKPTIELMLQEPPRAEPAAAPAPTSSPPPQPPYTAPIETDFMAPDEAEERKQAHQVFEAKEMDVNPRKPFYITVGALSLFAVGTVGYFWYEMQPKNNYKLPPPSAQSAAPVAAAPPAATTVTPPAGTELAPPQSPAAGPGATPAVAAPAISAPAAAPAAVKPGAPGDARPGQAAPIAAAAPTRAPRRESDIKITPAAIRTDPVLENAYRAFNAGDMARARDDYQQVLRNSPDNRDALLGLAAVEMQSRRFDAAENLYTRLLELDPRDAYAQAGLIGLKGQIDPLATESRLKNLISAQPEASFLNFTLGNQYAAQGRWAEAQQAYFRAYSGDSEHPDFAYNLAVSLDKMHQTKPALEYYRRALQLAEQRPVSFDKNQVSARVSQLAR